MNIAFSTILIFLFVLPGLAFRRFYYSGEFSKEYFKSTGLEIFFSGIVPAVFIHLVGYNLLPILTSRTFDLAFFSIEVPEKRIDFVLIGKLLIGEGDDEYFQKAFTEIGKNFNYIVFYNLSLIFLGVVAGITSKALVRNLKLDRKIKILRFQNEWHYILTSEVLDFPKVKKKTTHNNHNQKLSAVWVDALINIDEPQGAVLYSGILEEYKLSKEGGLDLLYLTRAYRRKMKDDHIANSAKRKRENNKRSIEGLVSLEEDGPYYLMPDHYFILKYTEIKNLNIYYAFEAIKRPKWDRILSNVLGAAYLFGIFYLWFWLTKSYLIAIILGMTTIYLLSKFGGSGNHSDKIPDKPEVKKEN